MPPPPEKADIWPSTEPCKYCEAKRFYHEPKYFCCADGEISLILNNVPDALYSLYTSRSKESVLFHKYVRTYNNTFAFTSFGVKYDKSLCKRNKEFTHLEYKLKFIIILTNYYLNNDPKYLPLYLYDTDHKIENRLKQSEKLD